MNILIFGADGFIASNLYEFYVKKYPSAHFTLLGRNECQSAFSIKANLNKSNPDIIINSAAEIYNTSKMWFSNVVLVEAILDWMVVSQFNASRSTRFIQIGSSLEYGNIDRPISESDPVLPVDLYSGTKAAATMLCQGYAKEYNLKILIARPFSVYGPYEKDHRLFPTLYRAFYQNESMTLYEGNHDFIYVDDFVVGINKLVDLLDKEPQISGNIINFGTGHSTSNFELFEIWKEVTGIDSPPVQIKNTFLKKFETKRTWVNDPWVSNYVYGFQCNYNINAGVKEYINRMKNGSN